MSTFFKLFVAISISFTYLQANNENGIVFISIECLTNKKWINETECYLKPVAFKIFKWSDGFGYRPYLVDDSVDVCKLMKKSSKNPIHIKLRELLALHSNMNHSCPYQGYVLSPGVLPTLTVIPSVIFSGKYRVVLNFSTSDDWLSSVDVSVLITSKLST